MLKMITGIEFPFLTALLYPSLNYIWLFPKLKPDIEKEIKHEQNKMYGVEIYDYHPPTYVNINNIIVPVGGGMNRVTKMLLTKQISKDKKKEYFNYRQINDKNDSKLSYTKVTYINTIESCVQTFKYYNIPVDRFAINLPLRIDSYNYRNGFYIHKLGYIASNKDKLVKEVLWCKRLPLTITIPSIAITCLATCWLYYGILYPYSETYYPPFHYKRILSFVKK